MASEGGGSAGGCIAEVVTHPSIVTAFNFKHICDFIQRFVSRATANANVALWVPLQQDYRLAS